MTISLESHNFRALRRTHWSPAGVCALVGPNGAGKTTLLELLHALLDDLGQALASPLDFVDPAHSDPRARFPGPQGRVLRNL